MIVGPNGTTPDNQIVSAGPVASLPFRNGGMGGWGKWGKWGQGSDRLANEIAGLSSGSSTSERRRRLRGTGSLVKLLDSRPDSSDFPCPLSDQPLQAKSRSSFGRQSTSSGLKHPKRA